MLKDEKMIVERCEWKTLGSESRETTPSMCLRPVVTSHTQTISLIRCLLVVQMAGKAILNNVPTVVDFVC